MNSDSLRKGLSSPSARPIRKETDLSFDVDSLTKELLEVRLLTLRHGEYAFRERYIFYYFVAYLPEGQTIRRQGPTNRSRMCVQSVGAGLRKRSSLPSPPFEGSFHCRYDNGRCESDISYVEPARLEGELSVLLEPEIHPLELRDEKDNDKQARLEEQKQVADETQLAHLAYPLRRDATIDEIGLVGQLSAALKTLQILGQLLKNFPANLRSSAKSRYGQ